MVKRKCQVCGRERVRGHYNKHYNSFICGNCAESEESKPYGRYCESCGCDTFIEKHKENCGNE